MIIVDDKIDDDERMHLVRRPFRWPQRCAGAIQTASPDAACPGLLRKPLDAGIGRLLAPYRLSGRQGNRQTNNNQQMHLKRWPNRWPWRCAGTEPPTSPDGGGLGLCKMPLNAAIGRVLRPTDTCGHSFFVFLRVFSSSTRIKTLPVESKAPVFNRGITYQTKEKGLTKVRI